MTSSKEKGDDSGWIEAVARRAKVDPKIAEQVLDTEKIRPSPHLPRPRVLRLLCIKFAGQKRVGGIDSPFSFDWPLDAGVNCLASDGNLVGKSSVLRVLLWALRGEPRNLQTDVRSWIRNVDVSFAIDGVRHQVAFAPKDGDVQGEVRRGNGASPRPIARFGNNGEFASCMGEIMCDALGLERLPSWQSYAGSEDGQVISHGWPAYCGALVIAEAAHKVLLGETEQAGLPGRLLQMFMGLPWATTAATAKAKERELSQRIAGAARRRAEDASARDQEEVRLKTQIDVASATLAAIPDDRESIALSEAAFQQLSSAQEKMLAAERALEATRVEAEAARGQRLEDQARLQDAEEARLARRFFDGLDPSCCPRCDAKIDAERRKLEKLVDQCAVCASPLGVPPADETALVLMRDAAHASAAAESAANKRLTERTAHRDKVAAELRIARDALTAARSRAEASGARRKAEIELARLEGALEERVRTHATVQGTVAGEPDPKTVAVVRAAAQEADARSKQVADDIFTALNDEVCRLAQDFGMSALSSVRLDRASHLTATKSGHSTSFGSLTPGERLRLRVATVAGLLRVASDRGVGRHPGVLLLDSPGSEEVKGDDAAELVRELARVASGIDGFQILVTTARPDVVAKALPAERIRRIARGQYAW